MALAALFVAIWKMCCGVTVPPKYLVATSFAHVSSRSSLIEPLGSQSVPRAMFTLANCISVTGIVLP